MNEWLLTARTISEIKRIYIQDGKMIDNAMVTNISGQAVQMPGTVTEDFCTATNASDYLRLGGTRTMGETLARGMVLIFSLWNSDGDFMNWLDSGTAGPCNATEGDPALILANNPDLSVTFSNIKYGEIGSTFMSTGLSAVDGKGTSGQSQSSGAPSQLQGLPQGGISSLLALTLVVYFLTSFPGL